MKLQCQMHFWLWCRQQRWLTAIFTFVRPLNGMQKSVQQCRIFLTCKVYNFPLLKFEFCFYIEIYWQKINFSDSKAKRFYYKLLCLPLLPSKSIRLAFHQLKLKIEAYQMLHGFDGAFDRFLKYYEQQWISGERHVSVVLPISRLYLQKTMKICSILF